MEKIDSKNPFTIEADGLTKRFNNRAVFKNICFSIRTGNSLAITGPNGSGKSTLLEIIGGVQKPTKGSVKYCLDGKDIASKLVRNYIGFVSPKINPYSELTGLENIHFVLGPEESYQAEINKFIKKFDLHRDQNKSLKHYSSGMKQKLKLLLAILQDPSVLLLDEPGSNLDSAGKDIIYSYLKSVKNEKIIIIATNENEETGICDKRIKLG